jgi:hypothetical protein
VNRRSLLASIPFAMLARLRGLVPEPIQRHPALADSHKSGRLPEIRWGSLSAEQQAILLRATESFDGSAGAVCSWDFPSDPRWSASASIYTVKRMAVYDSLFRLGLLTFTSKMPEHEYDLCGWYTISQYGLEVALGTEEAARRLTLRRVA